MIDFSVPARNSRWSGTGTVIVPSASDFCIAMWLPRLLASTKPWAERIRQTSPPDRTRSLANRDFDVGHVNFAAKALVDFFRAGGLEEQG